MYVPAGSGSDEVGDSAAARASTHAELSVCRIYVSPCWPLSLLLLSWSGDHQCWWYSELKWSAVRGSTVGTSKRNIAAPQYVVIAKACRAEEDL